MIARDDTTLASRVLRSLGLATYGNAATRIASGGTSDQPRSWFGSMVGPSRRGSGEGEGADRDRKQREANIYEAYKRCVVDSGCKESRERIFFDELGEPALVNPKMVKYSPKVRSRMERHLKRGGSVVVVRRKGLGTLQESGRLELEAQKAEEDIAAERRRRLPEARLTDVAAVGEEHTVRNYGFGMAGTPERMVFSSVLDGGIGIPTPE